MKNILLCILLATGAFHAAGTALAQDSRKTAVEIWNDAIEKAAKAGGFIKDYGESRVVHRGAKPEVILRGDQLTFNGQQLKIGQSIDAWIKVLPRERRCESGERSGSCVWDDLGLQAVLDFRNPGKVRAFYVFLRLPEMILDTTFQPSKPFPGYLELDGFGIDAQTAFWEVRKASDAACETAPGRRGLLAKGWDFISTSPHSTKPARSAPCSWPRIDAGFSRTETGHMKNLAAFAAVTVLIEMAIWL
jgi:hypothetical protein